MDGKWDLQKFEKEDLQRFKARLVQKCNIQNPNDLTWDDILAHIREHVQADLANIKPTESVGNATLKSKIKDFLWTLYEKTLKVVVDAVMERWWPK